MAGHSKWAQIKHKKATADERRGQLFSKLLNAVAVAARENPNPELNPRLRGMIEKARESQVPNDNIDRALKRSADQGNNLEELMIEAYGPGGAAIIVYVVTSSRNRALGEIKQILKEHDAKWAEPGSVRWAFEAIPSEAFGWKPKYSQKLKKDDEERLKSLLQTLKDHPEVQKVYTNAR